MSETEDRIRRALRRVATQIPVAERDPALDLPSSSRRQPAKSGRVAWFAAAAVFVVVVGMVAVGLMGPERLPDDPPVRQWERGRWSLGAEPPDDAKRLFDPSAPGPLVAGGVDLEQVFYIASGGQLSGTPGRSPEVNWRYDVARDTWHEMASLPVEESFVAASAAVYDGQLFALGHDCPLQSNTSHTGDRWAGCEPDAVSRPLLARYDVDADRWEELSAPLGVGGAPGQPQGGLGQSVARLIPGSADAPVVAHERLATGVASFPGGPPDRVIESLQMWDEGTESWAELPMPEQGIIPRWTCSTAEELWAIPTRTDAGLDSTSNPPLGPSVPLSFELLRLPSGAEDWESVPANLPAVADLAAVSALGLHCGQRSVLISTVGPGEAPPAMRPGVLAIRDQAGQWHPIETERMAAQVTSTGAGFAVQETDSDGLLAVTAQGELVVLPSYTPLPSDPGTGRVLAAGRFLVATDETEQRFAVLPLPRSLLTGRPAQ